MSSFWLLLLLSLDSALVKAMYVAQQRFAFFIYVVLFRHTSLRVSSIQHVCYRRLCCVVCAEEIADSHVRKKSHNTDDRLLVGIHLFFQRKKKHTLSTHLAL